MPLINFKDATKLYHGSTQIQKAYLGSQIVYAQIITDPYLANVVLYLKGDGDDNSTNIIDSSPTPKTITRYGDTKVRTTQKKYGTGSIWIPSTGYLLYSDQNFVIGTTPFTIEAWVYLPYTYANNGFFCISSTTNPSTEPLLVTFYQYDIYNTTNNGAVYPYPNNQWFHLAIVRENTGANGLKYYVNGVKRYEMTFSNNLANYRYIIGSYYSSSYGLNGYIDSFRITNIARYTANFNPETDTYLAY